MLAFLKANWPWVASIGIPFLMTLLATIANRFSDPDNNPETPPPRWVQILRTIVDLLSWVGRDGKLSFPGKGTGEPPMTPPNLNLLLILFIAGLVVGCAGFKSKAYETLTLIVNGTAAARDQLPKTCEALENAAVDASATEMQARAAVGRLQDRCAAALAGTEAVSKAAQVARDGVHDFSIDASALTWAREALTAYRSLSELLATLNVKLPKLPAGV